MRTKDVLLINPNCLPRFPCLCSPFPHKCCTVVSDNQRLGIQNSIINSKCFGEVDVHFIGSTFDVLAVLQSSKKLGLDKSWQNVYSVGDYYLTLQTMTPQVVESWHKSRGSGLADQNQIDLEKIPCKFSAVWLCPVCSFGYMAFYRKYNVY